jgi:peptidoglycan hydrolase-like protein with peptidoglycan-binding domain
MEIISRQGWGARPPRSVTTVPWPKRTRVDVHYSAGPPTQTPKQIQAYHMDSRGWADVGYNFLVDRGGKVYEGRGWTVLGSHIAGHNTAGIGVCFIGRDSDVTEQAKAAIRWLYDEACRLAGRRLDRGGHRDLAATACPGDRLHAWVHAGMLVDEPKPTPPPAAPKPAPATPAQLVVDGRLGPKTIRRWQQEMGTTADGEISTPSELVRAVQRHLNKAIKAGLAVDGVGIRQDGKPYKTVKALQKYLGTPQDSRMSEPVSVVVKAVQRRLNSDTF